MWASFEQLVLMIINIIQVRRYNILKRGLLPIYLNINLSILLILIQL